MGIKILFTYDYGKEKMEAIRALGYEVFIRPEKGVIYKEELKDIEVLVCYDPFKTLDITKMKKLKWIQLSSIGVDQAPLEYIKEQRIVLTNNKGGYSIPMGEWIVLKALEMIKHSKALYANQAKKRWKMDTNIIELYGKTIGFLGTGSIAIEGAKRLQGFGVKVIGMNTDGRTVQYFDQCYAMKDMEQMLPLCDIVVVTIPYTQENYHFLDAHKFSMMKKGVYLINVARGNIIEEKHLIEYLQNGHIRAAALDVFEEEPLPADNPLWELDNVIITSHNSWVSEQRNERRFEGIFENMKRYIKKQELLNRIDVEKGY